VFEKKIIIITNTFYPDRNSASKLLQELSKNLSRKKFDVLVICARSNKKNKKFTNFKNIKINNVFCKNIKNSNLYLRGLAELSISKQLISESSKLINKFKPTHLICYSPPIFFEKYIIYLKKNFGCKSFLILRDLFPFWAISTKIIRNYLLSKVLINKFKSFIKVFDCVGVEAKYNINYLKKKKVVFKKIIHLPNWIDIKNNSSNSKNIKNNFVFGGNIGLGQDIKKVCDLYNKLSDLSSSNSFKIIGTGFTENLINLNLKKKTLKKIKIFGTLEPNIYDKEIKKSSFGVVSLDDRIESVNFPGRMLNYIKLGLPIVLLTNKSNELSKFVIKNQIGVVVGSNTNILKKIIILKKIKKNFLMNNYNKKIILKYFNTNKITKKIIKNIEN
tara:strand:+ start:981 stop:2144 length:1164 start_codon:yes stop_codon:yes gene_type:complete